MNLECYLEKYMNNDINNLLGTSYLAHVEYLSKKFYLKEEGYYFRVCAMFLFDEGIVERRLLSDIKKDNRWLELRVRYPDKCVELALQTYKDVFKMMYSRFIGHHSTEYTVERL